MFKILYAISLITEFALSKLDPDFKAKRVTSDPIYSTNEVSTQTIESNEKDSEFETTQSKLQNLVDVELSKALEKIRHDSNETLKDAVSQITLLHESIKVLQLQSDKHQQEIFSLRECSKNNRSDDTTQGNSCPVHPDDPHSNAHVSPVSEPEVSIQNEPLSPKFPPQSVLTPERLYTIASQIPKFDPDNCEKYSITDHLVVINFYLEDFPGATKRQKINLIGYTATPEIMDFLIARSDATYQEICEKLIAEYKLYTETGYSACKDIEHRPNETPSQFYRKLKTAWFGENDSSQLENDSRFKEFFLLKLNPTIFEKIHMTANPAEVSMTEIRYQADRMYHYLYIRPKDKDDNQETPSLPIKISRRKRAQISRERAEAQLACLIMGENTNS